MKSNISSTGDKNSVIHRSMWKIKVSPERKQKKWKLISKDKNYSTQKLEMSEEILVELYI